MATERAVAKSRAREVPASHPFSLMRRFSEEMDRVFADFLGRAPGWAAMPGRSPMSESGWVPNVDIFERKGELVVNAELPGLAKDDVKVEIADDLLTIQGEKREDKEEEKEGYYATECRYGSFYRAIPLPEGADAQGAKASFKNGMLEVTIPRPRTPLSKGRELPIAG